MKTYLELARVKHYIKNILVFIPLLFSGSYLNGLQLLRTILAFISFSFLTSVIYIINDFCDIEEDKKDEVKRHRPLASGRIRGSNAIIFAVVLFVCSMLINFFSTDNLLRSYSIILVYLLMNVSYSFKLKNYPIIDIMILAFGFVLRIFYGASIIDVQPSSWLILTILFFALFISFSKRRNELIISSASVRKVLKHYTASFLNQFMCLFLTLTLVSYSLWTISIDEQPLMIWTLPIILMIFMKYVLNLEQKKVSDPVDLVLKDKSLMLLIVLYAVFVFILLTKQFLPT